MNFFSAQQSARRSTVLLVFLFLTSILFLLLLSSFFLFQYLYFLKYSSLTFSLNELSLVYNQQLLIMLSTAILAFIIIASFYKLMTLLAGGKVIAQSLGGRIISRNSSNPDHKKVLNVVEEMALASGMPVPQVYLLNEKGINAFAAGWKISNAVIGITQGALETLTRDELQGVIAHEFSHIFNGDMKINIRLIAILYSILVIGQLGQFALRSLRYGHSSRHSKKGNGLLPILAIGISMSIIGYSGTFFGNWIKSLISRQREYLADASAVQFTRNNSGIANALKKIGGAANHSYITSASSAEYSHGYFALSDTHSSFMSFATHPPLKDRIKRLQPNWNGQFITEKKPEPTTKPVQKPSHQSAIFTGIAINAALNSIDTIGDVKTEQLDLAQLWKQNTPDFIHLYSEQPSDARLLIFALLLDSRPHIALQQYEHIEHEQQGGSKTVKWLVHQLQQLEISYDVHIIELSLPSLKLMSLQQFKTFKNTLKKLIKADHKINLKEWIIQRMVLQHLNEHFSLRKKPLQNFYIIGSAKKPIETTLSLLSYLEHPLKQDAEHSFNLAKKSIGAHAFNHLEQKQLTLKLLDHSIDQLEQLKPPLKQKFLKAASHCIAHDGNIKKQSYELLRAISTCIDAPLAPIYAQISTQNHQTQT